MISPCSIGAKSASAGKCEVVDNQQGLRTIFEFHNGDLNLAKDADDIDSMVVTKMHYTDRPEDLRLRVSVVLRIGQNMDTNEGIANSRSRKSFPNLTADSRLWQNPVYFAHSSLLPLGEMSLQGPS